MLCCCTERHEHSSALQTAIVFGHSLQVSVEIQIRWLADVFANVVSGLLVVADFLAINVMTIPGDF